MAKGNTKQRAKKKQQKQQQRKKKLARREGHTGVGPAGRGSSQDVLQGWDPDRHGTSELAHRKHLGFVDAAHYVDLAVRAGRPGTENIWTLSRVAACPEEALLTKLASLGIVTDRAAYLAATEGDASAHTHAAALWARALTTANVHDYDFAWLAAIDLWRRWRPERPSREAMLLRHLEGWAADTQDRPLEAIEAWLDFGEMVFKAFPNARRMEDIDALFKDPHEKGSNFFFDGFANVLIGVASEAASNGEADAAARVGEFLSVVLQRLPESPREQLEVIEAGRAQLLADSGRREEGVALLRAMIERAPNRGVGYAMLAAALIPEDNITLADLEEALAVLRKGLAEADDAKQWDLAARVEAMEALAEEHFG